MLETYQMAHNKLNLAWRSKLHCSFPWSFSHSESFMVKRWVYWWTVQQNKKSLSQNVEKCLLPIDKQNLVNQVNQWFVFVLLTRFSLNSEVLESMWLCDFGHIKTVHSNRHFNTIRHKHTRLQRMVHHRKYPLFTSDLDLVDKAAQNTAQYPLHHVIYAPAKFGVAVSNSYKKIHSLTLTKGHTQYCSVPSTSWDLFLGKVWSG